jgi:sulfite exporter TauE/SafE
VPGLDNLQQILAFAAGGVMILMGLVVMGLWPRRARPVGKDGLGATLFRQFFAAPSAGGALVLGMACGLLPCPILVAMLAQSLASRSVLAGAIMLAGLGVGTMAGLLPVGLAGSWARRLTRRWAAAVGGIVLVLLGAVTILRGTGAFHQVLGCPGQEQSDCCHGKQ